MTKCYKFQAAQEQQYIINQVSKMLPINLLKNINCYLFGSSLLACYDRSFFPHDYDIAVLDNEGFEKLYNFYWNDFMKKEYWKEC